MAPPPHDSHGSSLILLTRGPVSTKIEHKIRPIKHSAYGRQVLKGLMRKVCRVTHWVRLTIKRTLAVRTCFI